MEYQVYTYDIGRDRTGLDGYWEDRDVFQDLVSFYDQSNTLLTKEGTPLSTETFQQLPYISDGMLTGPIVSRNYRLKGCLVENLIRPHNYGMCHQLSLAALDQQTIAEVVRLLDAQIPDPRLPESFRQQGRWDASHIYLVPERVNLERFKTLEQLYNFIHTLPRLEAR